MNADARRETIRSGCNTPVQPGWGGPRQHADEYGYRAWAGTRMLRAAYGMQRGGRSTLIGSDQGWVVDRPARFRPSKFRYLRQSRTKRKNTSCCVRTSRSRYLVVRASKSIVRFSNAISSSWTNPRRPDWSSCQRQWAYWLRIFRQCRVWAIASEN